uniref:Ig-like domain-containing protein n=1 Tax=Cyprinodon variegatus TaxID=28743 RepID=A0A3Q2CXD4_CYPVA
MFVFLSYSFSLRTKSLLWNKNLKNKATRLSARKGDIIMDILGGAPRVLGYPRPVVAQCGTDVTLRCQIGGDPPPDVIWEHKNFQIISEGRYKISEEGKTYLLNISRVTQEDAGQYICKARNSIGETYAAASLKVEGELLENNREIIQLKENGVNQCGDFGENLNGYIHWTPRTVTEQPWSTQSKTYAKESFE